MMVRSLRDAADSVVSARLCELPQCDKSGKQILRVGGPIATRASREIAFATPRAPCDFGEDGRRGEFGAAPGGRSPMRLAWMEVESRLNEGSFSLSVQR